MDTDDQRRLADAAREGDRSAWEELYRNVYARLHAYAAARVEIDSAEDMVNETMSRAVAGIEKFKWTGGGFDAWLFGILRRVCLEHHRRNRVARTRPDGVWIDYTDPGDDMERRVERDAVRQAFSHLDDSDRDILALRLISGLSADEVARLVGKSPGAVRTAQSRALANLRLLMGQLQ